MREEWKFLSSSTASLNPRFLDKSLLSSLFRLALHSIDTDSREYEILSWTVKTGVLEGAEIPFLTELLKLVDKASNVLKISVLGAILQHYVPVLMKAEEHAETKDKRSLFTPETEALKDAFRMPSLAATPSYKYKARVLEGIWAAAPYLHNGSVPTLAELLKPAAERVSSFK